MFPSSKCPPATFTEGALASVLVVRELVLSIVLHAGLGIALALGIWALGHGWLLALPRTADFDPRHAYAVGLFVATAASFLLLLSPWLALVALLLVAVGAAGTARRLAIAAAAARRGLPPLGWALPGALGLPVALGLLLHGPTDDVESAAYGDMLYYVNKVVSGAQSVVPFHDLLAEGQRIIYAEAAPSFIGAVCTHLPGFDAVLFQAASAPAFLLTAVCVGIGLTPAPARHGPALILVLALAAVALVPYPTWITESPPVAFALPLAFSLDALDDDRLGARAVALLAGILAVDLFMTKVVGFVPLSVLAGFILFRRLERRAAIAAGIGLAAVAVAALFLTAGWYADLLKPKFLPWDALRGLHAQLTHRDTQAAAPAFIILGELLLGAALVRARRLPLAAALGLALVGSYFVGGYGFDIAVGMTIFLAALAFYRDPPARAALPLLATGACFVALSAWFRDVSAIRAGFAFTLLLGLGLFLAFARGAAAPAGWALYALAASGAALALDLAGHSFVAVLPVAVAGAIAARGRPRRLRPALAVAGLVVAGVVGTAAWRANDLRLSENAMTLTSDDYEVWQAVHRLVPRDGLVFTSMTGKAVDGRQGWNNYPSIAERQLYLAGWYDGRLTARPDELDRRLLLNTRVLSGALAPKRVPLSRRFDSYYAVVRTGVEVPRRFRPLYANDSFALYRIAS